MKCFKELNDTMIKLSPIQSFQILEIPCYAENRQHACLESLCSYLLSHRCPVIVFDRFCFFMVTPNNVLLYTSLIHIVYSLLISP